MNYPIILKCIINIETLAIPAIKDIISIKDMPLDKWLFEGKEILKDDVGCDTGLICDLLVSKV